MPNFQLVELPKIKDARNGSLGFAELDQHIPLLIKRAFFLYDLPNGSTRGGHAHKEQKQFMICLKGALEVKMRNQQEKTDTLQLENPTAGLYIPPMVWLDLTTKSENTICVVLVSDIFKESDYIRDY